jgi:hypothetical protein
MFLCSSCSWPSPWWLLEFYNWFFCSSVLNTPLVCIFMLTMVAKHQRLSKKDAVWKVKNSRLCVKPDIHSYPQFLTRIVTASVIFPSKSVCTGVCQHTVSGTMTKMAAYSELDWSNKKWSVGHQGLCSCTTSLVHRLNHFHLDLHWMHHMLVAQDPKNCLGNRLSVSKCLVKHELANCRSAII